MANSPLFYFAGFACLAVLVVLLFGIGSFARGGEFNRRNSNKIMQLRILLQAVAVGVILLFVALSGGRN